MKMLQERSKRTLKRLMMDHPIRFRNGKFLYKLDNSEVKGLYYKKKYWEQLGLKMPEDKDYNEDDDLEQSEDEVDGHCHEHIGDSDSEHETQEEGEKKAKTTTPVVKLIPQAEQVDLKDLVEERHGINIKF
jgi:hypothetical protein